MLPGIRWCGIGLPLFPTACSWLTHPAAMTGVSVSVRWDSPRGCVGPSVPLLCNRSSLQVCSQATVPVHNLNVVVCPCVARQLIGSIEGL